MTQVNNLTHQSHHPAPLGKHMLVGAAIALVLIVIFLLGTGASNPAWPKY